MSLRTVAIVAAAVVLAGGVLVFAELPAVSPGTLAQAHHDLGLQCRACHAPFRGANSGCVQCHGGLPPTNDHADIGLDCTTCHREHRGADQALAARAGDTCTTCHEHSSIMDVARHRKEFIERPGPLPPSPQVHPEASFDFSHRGHFDEIADQKLPGDAHECQRCHLVGGRSDGEPGAEQRLRWDGCRGCHDTWQEAGFPDAPPEAAEVSFASPRLLGVRFSHSVGHLETPCRDCHVDIDHAEAARKPRAGAEHTASKTRNCFSCHPHEPDAETRSARWSAWPTHAEAAPERRVVACTECHEFHGTPPHGDFPNGPAKVPPPAPWDVLISIAGVAITPWLLAFAGLGALGFIAIVRRFPANGRESQDADPDVAPQRTSEVPVLSPSYESSIEGLFIIGELAGVPLINRSMKSGFDAIDFIANRLETDGRKKVGGDVVDVLIAGAGPAGLGAATRAKSLKLSYVLSEKTTPAATIQSFPRAKIVQAAPIDIPEYGTFFQENDESKEGLVRRWQDIVARTGVVVNEREELIQITRDGDGILVSAVEGGKQYRSRFVVLAIGVRGTPRRLGMAGETPERVLYALIDAAEYSERQILVTGGGNAACEAALALADPKLLNRVTLAHRGPTLKGVTAQNAQAVDAAAREAELQVVPDSSLKEIGEHSVVLATPSGDQEIPNEIVFALIGAELPTKFLRAIGVRLLRKGGA